MSRERVLVVEDSEATAKVVTKILNSCGFTDIDHAASAEIALELLQRRPYKFVISDIYMNGMTGIEMLAKIRGSSALADTCVILMTTARDQQLLNAARDFNPDAIMLKPFTVVALKDKLAAIPKLQDA
jgi:two-component system chemotaxis response regulator CheY